MTQPHRTTLGRWLLLSDPLVQMLRIIVTYDEQVSIAGLRISMASISMGAPIGTLTNDAHGFVAGPEGERIPLSVEDIIDQLEVVPNVSMLPQLWISSPTSR